MKRLVGATAAVSSFLMPVHGASAQEANPRCQAVYSEYHGDTSTQLRDVIDDYSQDGVELHVQFLSNGQEAGITSSGGTGQEQAKDYANDLKDECRWGEGVLMFVVLRDEASGIKLFRAMPDQALQEEFPESKLDEQKSWLQDALNDASEPDQVDVARYLAALDLSSPVLLPEINDARNESTNWLGVVIGLGSVAVASVGTFMGVRAILKRRRELKIADKSWWQEQQSIERLPRKSREELEAELARTNRSTAEFRAPDELWPDFSLPRVADKSRASRSKPKRSSSSSRRSSRRDDGSSSFFSGGFFDSGSHSSGGGYSGGSDGGSFDSGGSGGDF